MEENKKRVGYCRDMARSILKKSNSFKLPIPVFEIAKYFDFTVVFLDQPPDKFSGIMHRSKKAIGINKHHHIVRQRFSLAHELGHYFLDHPSGDEIMPDEVGSKQYKIFESEADEFAAELLVPRELLKDVIKKNSEVEFLKEHFQVSRHVIVIQLSKHGLLMKI